MSLPQSNPHLQILNLKSTVLYEHFCDYAQNHSLRCYDFSNLHLKIPAEKIKEIFVAAQRSEPCWKKLTSFVRLCPQLLDGLSFSELAQIILEAQANQLDSSSLLAPLSRTKKPIPKALLQKVIEASNEMDKELPLTARTQLCALAAIATD